MEIRTLSDSDYPALRKIYTSAFNQNEHPKSDLLDSWEYRSEENSYGLFVDSLLIGFAICSFQKKSGPNMYLDYIAVDETIRGHGYGSILLQMLIDKCHKEHRSLHLFPDSFELVKWYKKFGFYETLDREPLEGKPPFYMNLHSYG